MKDLHRSFDTKLKSWSLLATFLLTVFLFCPLVYAQKEAVKEPQVSKAQSGGD